MLAERGTGGAGEGSGDDDAGGSWKLKYRHGGEWKRTSQRGPAALGATHLQDRARAGAGSCTVAVTGKARCKVEPLFSE